MGLPLVVSIREAWTADDPGTNLLGADTHAEDDVLARIDFGVLDFICTFQ